MRSGRGQRSPRLVFALPVCMSLGLWACASSTPIEVTGAADTSTVAASEVALPPTAATGPVPDPTVATTAEPTTTAIPDCVGLPELPSGAQTFDHEGVPRTYRLAKPRGYDGSQAMPMIVVFHGSNTDAVQFDENTLMSKLGTEQGFVVVTPDSSSEPQSWNVRAEPDRDDDFTFVHELVAALQQVLCIDAARIFVAGHANGAVFAAYLACSAPFEFAALAMVSATTPGVCPDDVQPTVLAIAGTADEANPYDDPTGAGAVDVMTGWAQHDGCTQLSTVAVQEGVDAIHYQGCADAAAEVVLLTVDGGGHPWPGSTVAANLETNSVAGKKFNATSAILEFFQSHGGGQ